MVVFGGLLWVSRCFLFFPDGDLCKQIRKRPSMMVDKLFHKCRRRELHLKYCIGITGPLIRCLESSCLALALAEHVFCLHEAACIALIDTPPFGSVTTGLDIPLCQVSTSDPQASIKQSLILSSNLVVQLMYWLLFYALLVLAIKNAWVWKNTSLPSVVS